MHYSLKNSLTSRAYFYFAAGIMIIGFFVIGIVGRKATEEDTVVAPTQTPSNTVISNETTVNLISVYDHSAKEEVNMDLEEYVVCAVAGEMPASFDIEALKAQSVAARTIAYKYINEKNGCNGCDICTDAAHVQGYADVDKRRQIWGNEYDKWQAIIEKAVYETLGEILVYNGEPIDVMYHASSNGQTEASIDVFSGSREYLVSVASLDEGQVADSISVANKDFIEKVNTAYSSANLSTENLKNQISILSYTQSDRVEEIRLGNEVISGREFRELFKIKSTLFSLDFIENTVVISTLGYGHGVGMSQRGADAMASEGSDYIEILKHYYKGIQISNYNQ